MLIRQGAGKVVVRLGGGEASFLHGAFTPHHNETPGKGEVGFQGLDGEGMEASGFDSAVGGLGL